jgi:hypothetical protein
MTCKEAIDVLGEFLEESLTPELAAELERHLLDCQRLHRFLLDRLSER